MVQCMMISDDDIDALPDDPDAAFVQYEAIIREEVARLNASGSQNSDPERQYIAHVLAFVDTKTIPLSLPRDPPSDDQGFYDWYRSFLRAVDYYKAVARLQIAARKKEHVSILTLDADFKTQIGGHLTAIRKIVGEADISANKRDAIFRRINNLQEEVDRDRTRTEAAFALLLDLTSAISNGAKNLDPALDRVERIIKVLAKAKDENETKALTAPKDRKRIAPPNNTPEPTEPQPSDDEIPF
jgi:hypothetical protein